MFGRDIRTKLPNLVEEGRKPKDIQTHHREYKDKMKQYADQTNRAKEHDFRVGDIVYIASMDNGKLDAKFKDTRYVLLRNTSDNSFELVNTNDGSMLIRNVKHLRHTPVVIDFDVAVPVEAHEDPGALEMSQSAPTAECPPEQVSETVPENVKQGATRSGRVIRKPARYRDT